MTEHITSHIAQTIADSSQQDTTMTVRVDPELFERGYWKVQNANSMLKMQVFVGLFLGNLKQHPDEISKVEIDAFVMLLDDPIFLAQAYDPIRWLQNDL